jgi:5-methylcytosine-specific restriction endonuclease McrA
MQRVFVFDKHRKPLMPCHPARARALLKARKAAVLRRQPFTIILTERDGGDVQALEAKFDPGSKTTGIALNLHGQNGVRTIWAANLRHRGHQISEALTSRATTRRARRNRKTRYRAARFDNRAKPKGWLAPSVLSRIHNCETWAVRLCRSSPVTCFTVETVRFDTQKMTNPDIAGAEYQQGELAGYELREFILYRDRHTCQYCHGASRDPVLEIDHIQARSKGGSDSVKNLVTSCRTCNQAKGNKLIGQWLDAQKGKRTKLAKVRLFGIANIAAGKFQSMRDAAAVNAARYRLGDVLKNFGLPTEFASGGRTKYNRSQQHYEKDHWIDAACAGQTGEKVAICAKHKPLLVAAKGHGTRQMCRPDRYGFPRTGAKSTSRVRGFQTGDLVSADVPRGKRAGKHRGRVAVRSSGSFNITDLSGTIQGISVKHCRLLQASDGYQYN